MGSITENKQGFKVLIAGCALQLFFGIVYAWSVFVKPVSEQLNWDIDKVKLTSSFMLCFYALGILIGGKLQESLGTQKTVLSGGLLTAAGFLVTAFIPAEKAWLIYISYGIAGGFGVGAGYITIVTSGQKWFPKNRGFATGVIVCAFGLSTVMFAPLVEWLVYSFGLRITFLTLSASFFAITLALFRFIRQPDAETASATFEAAQKQYTLKEVLVTKEFYFIALSLMLVTTAYFTLNPSFKTLASERGLNDVMGTALVMITGVANAFGRLGLPLLSDKTGRVGVSILICIVTALCAILLCFAQSAAFIASVALVAFCYGGTAGIYSVMNSDYFGIKNVGANHGAVMVGFAISALFSPMLIGLLSNDTHKFALLAVLAFLGAVLLTLLMKSKRTGN